MELLGLLNVENIHMSVGVFSSVLILDRLRSLSFPAIQWLGPKPSEGLVPLFCNMVQIPHFYMCMRLK